MGHSRLGFLKRTREWKSVIDMIANGADASAVAAATARAAEKALLYVQHDAGFKEVVNLLVQLSVAGTKADPAGHLAAIGIPLSPQTSLAEIVSGVAEALDKGLDGTRKRGDFAEIAQRSILGTVAQVLKGQQISLFSCGVEDVNAALRSIRTMKGFSQIAKDFFGRIANECQQYFLSKTLATHVGEGQRFATTNQMNQFQKAVELHCHEAAVIVEKFSAEWYSKHMYEGAQEISREEAEGYGWKSMEKIQSEMKMRNNGDANPTDN